MCVWVYEITNKAGFTAAPATQGFKEKPASQYETSHGWAWVALELRAMSYICVKNSLWLQWKSDWILLQWDSTDGSESKHRAWKICRSNVSSAATGGKEESRAWELNNGPLLWSGRSATRSCDWNKSFAKICMGVRSDSTGAKGGKVIVTGMKEEVD